MFYFEETNKASNELLSLPCRAVGFAYWYLLLEGRFPSSGEIVVFVASFGQP